MLGHIAYTKRSTDHTGNGPEDITWLDRACSTS